VGNRRKKDAVRKLAGPVHVDEKRLRSENRQVMAEVFADEIDYQVQVRSGRTRGYNAAFINNEPIFAQPGIGKSLFELVGKLPMSRHLLAVEDSSLAKNECAGAKTGDVRAPLEIFPQPRNAYGILPETVFNLIIECRNNNDVRPARMKGGRGGNDDAVRIDNRFPIGGDKLHIK
jgi:hypothetical protein